MQFLTYRQDEYPRAMLAAAIRANPGQSYMLLPAELGRRWLIDPPEQRGICRWAAPGGDRAVLGR